MKNIDELLGVAKLSELMSNDKKDESKKVLWVLQLSEQLQQSQESQR